MSSARIFELIWKIGFGLLLACLLVIGRPANPAKAHAQLVQSSPQDGATLDRSPGEVRLWFNEAISERFSSARLLDASGSPIPVISMQRDAENQALLHLNLPELSDGLYRVDWRVLSEADGHFTAGILVFGVGDVGTIGAAPLPAVRPPPLSEVILRWLNYFVIIALAGAIAMDGLIVRRTLALSEAPGQVLAGRRRLMRWSVLCSLTALAIGVWMLIYQGQALRAGLPQGVALGETIWQILGDTRWGALWSIRQGIVLVLVVSTFLLLRIWGQGDVSGAYEVSSQKNLLQMPILIVVGEGLAVLVLLSVQGLNSHAAGLESSTSLAVMIDILHLLAASIWVGGLLSLVIAFLPLVLSNKQGASVLLRSIWSRFSNWALISVLFLILTGLYSLGRQVVTLDALLTSLYGRVLLGKVNIMLVMGIFGLLNAILLHPGLLQPLRRLLRLKADWTPVKLRQFPILVLTEISLGIVALFAAGVITASEPARGPRYAVDYGEIPSSQTKSIADLLVTLAVKPNQPGENIITVRAVSSLRPPPGDILRVILRIKPQDEVSDPISIDALQVGNGEFQVGGGHFRFSGRWDVEIIIRRKGIDDQIAQFDWIVPQAGLVSQPLISNYPWESILTGVAGALIAALLIILAGRAIVRRFW